MSFKSNLTSPTWWKAAVIRALRTAIVIAVPYVPTLIADSAYLVVLSAAGFGMLTSFATSLFGLAEADGASRPWHWAIIERGVKTAAQALLTAFGTATLFAEVDWSLVLPAVATAVLGSVLLGFLKTLPETETPLTQATVPVLQANPETGEQVEKSVPAVVPASDTTGVSAVG